MKLNDEKMNDALEAFCTRLIEGHPAIPTGRLWADIHLADRTQIKQGFLGPLVAALDVVAIRGKEAA